MHKAELRHLIRQRKQAFSRQQLEEWSLDVMEHLKQEPHFRKAQTILLYHSLPDEVATSSLLDELTNKTILLPRVINEEEMELRYYTGRQDLHTGAFGIMEPCGKLFTEYKEIDVAVVPGMAFDTAGHRLGRGRGYYDRFLSRVPYIYKIGVCFHFQLLGSVPSDENDIPMDLVISGELEPINRNGCRQ
jgi:5-formyltetrahydrofolate cyclo-ligase